MKIKLSAVIITFNEEKNIKRCLTSLAKVADEIIVVDSFSTDRTEEICSEFNCDFRTNPFEGHIQQKNFALQQASNDFILSLDADEELSEALIISILEVKENWNHDAYYFNRLSSYCGKFFPHGSWYPDQKIRLFDRNHAKWGGTNPHDKIILSSNSKKFLKGDLFHYTYHTIEEHIRQINYFSGIAAKAAYDQGKRFNVFKLIFKPFWRFFRDYFLKHGFLGGYRGLTICLLTAVETYLKIIKLWELERAEKIKSHT
ncbi:glycosyltransferase family 2 protein [Marivirga salinae]|uniref:Glycosyltransferase family 2 protein n=1 Tax=Marivirga salinarum TaxID=3059078 RepID=A0AA49GCB7_9BACT|nr:glycosyltransferase family 2 protein [Marivirga sp. BDSF4-3]WKK77401.2 glycosyltransferase family 2 protein [Marivirga sp. BDSF4-3]